ncbi:lysosomal Pro-X carboxypeptidase [Thrips palmi]|uniref:Lysosomal Pro-X carboxypeptidase n=1 Tax=Thrips palmi TaxID=161013 RepID=A0A6P8ZUH6_THRPL|nr:lysosomal Pro-X carboxypeptidase [Thrips palmi]
MAAFPAHLLLLALLALALRGAAAAVPFYDDSAKEAYKFDVKYITVPVDHFSFAGNETFRLRYLVNDTWWDKDRRKPGPIFFYTGNEGDINVFAQNTGFMWDIAAEFRALVVFAEHRYYGQSMPFGDKSFSDRKHLGYLTAQQALADFVAVIREVRKGQAFPRQSPVVAFGGSYGGMLSAWFRVKYPNVVAGAIAASAPVLMSAGLTPCDAFNHVVTSVYHTAAAECDGNIKRSWSAIRNITKTDEGKKWFSETFELRKPLKTAEDVNEFVAWLSDAYVDVAMANYPYPANFLGKMPAYPVKAVCNALSQKLSDEKQLAKAVFNGISVYFNYTGAAKALDINGTDAGLGINGWDFQACSEMAMPMCSDGRSDMFESSPWDESIYSNACFARWGVRPVFNMTGWEFGGRDFKGISNIVFSNGLLDPWSAGGVVRNMSDSVVAVLIPEGAHHLDLRAQNPADPPSVRGARRLHRQNIKKWIKQHWSASVSHIEDDAYRNRLLPQTTASRLQHVDYDALA